jgi:hypothetical protein
LPEILELERHRSALAQQIELITAAAGKTPRLPHVGLDDQVRAGFEAPTTTVSLSRF